MTRLALVAAFLLASCSDGGGAIMGRAASGFPAPVGMTADALKVAGPLTDAELRAVAVPVSGTFYQATQPVSGTFWQATQPTSNAPITDAFNGWSGVCLPLNTTVAVDAHIHLAVGTRYRVTCLRDSGYCYCGMGSTAAASDGTFEQIAADTNRLAIGRPGAGNDELHCLSTVAKSPGVQACPVAE